MNVAFMKVDLAGKGGPFVRRVCGPWESTQNDQVKGYQESLPNRKGWIWHEIK